MTGWTSAVLALAAWAAALAGRWHGFASGLASPVPAISMLGAGSVVVLVVLARRQPAPSTSGRRWILLLVIAGLMGAVGVGADVRARHVVGGPLAGRVLAPMSASGAGVRLTVAVVADPRPQQGGGWWWLARLVSIDSPTTWSSASRERVVVRSRDAPAMGSIVGVAGLAAPVDGGAAAWLRSLGVVVEVRATEVRLRAPPPAWLAKTTALRTRLASAAGRHLDVVHASLLAGLVTGDVSQQPQSLADDVDAAGLSHLVAVSGSNVALVVAGAMMVVLALGLGRRAAWRCSVLVVWWFVVLVRAEPSVVRAALMATLVLLAALKGRPREAAHLLGMAVVLALLLDPLLAARVGFILSVAATWGVLTITPRLVAVVPGPGWFRTAVAATIGAQVPVAPILLLIGGTVTAASLPANIVAVPAAAVASIVGAVVAIVAVASVPAAGSLAALAGPALGVVVWSARTFAGPTGVQVNRWTPWVVGGIAAVVLVRWAVRAWPEDWSTSSWRLTAAAGSALGLVGAGIGVSGLLPAAGSADAVARLIVLDVGQGDALLLTDGGGQWMLVDGGPDPAALRDGLRRHAVPRLAAVAITHPHADHDAGLIDLFGWIDVDTVIVGPPAGDPPVSPAVAQAVEAGVMVNQVHAGMAWRLGVLAVRVLSPPPTGIALDANESSIVLRVDAPNGTSALLTGDAEVIAQTRLLADPTAVDVDILKVPHHGGATNAAGFLAATTPDVAIISVGEGNSFGHPHPDVLVDLAGVAVRRTDVQGDVIVPLGPE